MDWFYLALLVALVAGMLGIALLIREPPSKPTRDHVAFSDAHTAERQRQLARLSTPAPKGISKLDRAKLRMEIDRHRQHAAGRPGWRFEDPNGHGKTK